MLKHEINGQNSHRNRKINNSRVKRFFLAPTGALEEVILDLSLASKQVGK